MTIGEPALAAVAGLGLEPVDEVDDVVKLPVGAGVDAASGNNDGKVRHSDLRVATSTALRCWAMKPPPTWPARPPILLFVAIGGLNGSSRARDLAAAVRDVIRYGWARRCNRTGRSRLYGDASSTMGSPAQHLNHRALACRLCYRLGQREQAPAYARLGDLVVGTHQLKGLALRQRVGFGRGLLHLRRRNAH